MTTDETHLLGAYFKHWRLQKGWPLEVIALKTRIPAKYLRALESNDFSALPPIEPLPHTLGESLREYRERQGLSIESIAERTRVPLASLHALEENNFRKLPEAPVIIRGFVDAYDAGTGKQAWRLWTVPSLGEPGAVEERDRRIDYVFVSSDVNVAGTYVPIDPQTRFAADHYPVISDVALPDGRNDNA